MLQALWPCPCLCFLFRRYFALASQHPLKLSNKQRHIFLHYLELCLKRTAQPPVKAPLVLLTLAKASKQFFPGPSFCSGWCLEQVHTAAHASLGTLRQFLTLQEGGFVMRLLLFTASAEDENCIIPSTCNRVVPSASVWTKCKCKLGKDKTEDNQTIVNLEKITSLGTHSRLGLWQVCLFTKEFPKFIFWCAAWV